MSTVLVGGLLSGLGAAAIAMGLWISYGRQRLVDIANSSFMLTAAYLVYTLTREGLNPIVAMALLLPAGAAFGFVFYLVFLDRFHAREHLESALFTFAVLILFQGILLVIWQGGYRSIATPFLGGGHTLGGIRIPTTQAVAAATGLVLAIAVFATGRFTIAGKVADAVCTNAERAATIGINTKLVNASLYAVATACATAGGLVIGITSAFSPDTILPVFVAAFMIATLGGPFGALGVLAAGVGLREFQSVVSYYYGGWEGILTFMALVVILIARPRVLFPDVTWH